MARLAGGFAWQFCSNFLLQKLSADIEFTTMKNLGAKLKAARESMQLTLRDVADVTRLRISVLEDMENGVFDSKLKDIYKRGFLRLYAAFLKLDVDAVMREYNTAMAMKQSEESRFGAAPAFVEDAPKDGTRFDDEPEEQQTSPDATAKYIKLGGAFVLAILLIVVVVMIVSSLTKRATSTPSAQPPIEPAVVASVDAPKVLSIEAVEEAYVTVFKNNASGAEVVVWTGTIPAGSKKDFQLGETLTVRATDASKIKMVRDGTVIYDKKLSGIRKFVVKPR